MPRGLPSPIGMIERRHLQIISRLVAALDAVKRGLIKDDVVDQALGRAGEAMAELRRCRICGCSEHDACAPPCSWAAEDLCSAEECHRIARTQDEDDVAELAEGCGATP